MRRLPALVAALLLPASPPLLLGTAAFTGALLVSQAPAQAQNAEAVAKVAQAITVRIEGATQGSGVLVKRDGNRYTVLTAWHVVSGQNPGEELSVITSDLKQHNVDPTKIFRIGSLDIATIEFTSATNYDYSLSPSSSEISLGEKVFICGYRLSIDNSIVNTKCELNQGTYVSAEAKEAGLVITYNAFTYSCFSG